jgi:hypothetical protein
MDKSKDLETEQQCDIHVVSKRTLTARNVIANVLKMYNLKYVSKKGLEEHIASLIEKDLYDSGHL